MLWNLLNINNLQRASVILTGHYWSVTYIIVHILIILFNGFSFY